MLQRNVTVRVSIVMKIYHEQNSNEGKIGFAHHSLSSKEPRVESQSRNMASKTEVAAACISRFHSIYNHQPFAPPSSTHMAQYRVPVMYNHLKGSKMAQGAKAEHLSSVPIVTMTEWEN